MMCFRCNQQVIKGEPDPCLGMLPGVTSACCGHGKKEGYLLFENGKQINFQIRYIKNKMTPGPDLGMFDVYERVI